MQVYIDLENLLKEKNISKNKVCEACKLQRTQLNNYCKRDFYLFRCGCLCTVLHIR